MRLYDRDIGRLLNARPLVFIGVISYSLYLWQQPFLNRNVFAALNRFPQNAVLAFIVSLLSYYLVERPMLGLRYRVEAWLPVRRRAVAPLP